MNIIRDSFFLTFSKGIRSVVMMAVVMIMTRITSLQDYGTYKQLTMLSNMALTIAPLGIPVSISYYYKNLDIKKRNTLVSNSIIICVLCGIISSISFIMFKNQISSSLNIDEINNYLFCFSLYVFILVASSFIENLYVSAEFAKIFSIFNIIYFAIFLVILVGVIYKGNELSTILYTMFILEAIRFIFMLSWILKKIKFKFKLDISFTKEQFMYCIPLGLVGIMYYLNNHLDQLLVSSYFNPSEFAIYSTGTMEIPIVGLVTSSLATVALPHMSKEYNTNHNTKKTLQIFGDITTIGAAIIFPVFFILFFYSKGYIGFLFSEKYFSCIPLFLVRLLRLPLSCTFIGNILIIIGKQKETIFIMLISIVVSLISNIIFIPILGMIGGALSGLIMNVIIIFLQLYKVSKYTKVKIKNLLPYYNLLKIFGVSFIVILPIFLFSNFFNFQYIVKFFIFGILAFSISIYTLEKLKLINLHLNQKLGFLRRKTSNIQDAKI